MPHVDLHLHLLPGIDDGPPDEAASLEHAARMVAAGVTEATVTPHVGHSSFPVDVATIPARTAALQHALDRHRLGLRLHPGGELHPVGAADLTPRELDAVAQGPPGERWVLLEAPFAGIDDAFLAVCARLRSLSLGLVVAHPERSAGFLPGGLRALRAELLRGALLQVSVCSLLGRHGAEAQATARRLLRRGLAYLLASDGHGGARAHTLAEGSAAARAAGVSAARAWQLTEANPGFLLRWGLPAEVVPRSSRAWRSEGAERLTTAVGEARRLRRAR